MKTISAVAALGALAHETRLEVFRLLVRAGAEGMAVGKIADALGVEANGRLSFHLKELVGAGLALRVPSFLALTPPGTVRARPGLPGIVATRGTRITLPRLSLCSEFTLPRL